MERRSLFSRLAALPLLAWGVARGQQPAAKPKLKIMMRSAWGSDDPTRASFPYVHGLALAEAGHDVQIFLVGEATYRGFTLIETEWLPPRHLPSLPDSQCALWSFSTIETFVLRDSAHRLPYKNCASDRSQQGSVPRRLPV